jgi:tetratricopeptide (TPR) repeat protein
MWDFFKKLFRSYSLKHSEAARRAHRAAVSAAEKVWNDGWESTFMKREKLSEEDRQCMYISRDMQLSNHWLQKRDIPKRERLAEAERLTRQAASRAERVRHAQTRCIAFQRLGDFLYQLRNEYRDAEHWLRRAAAEAENLTAQEQKGTLQLKREVFKGLAEVLQLRGKVQEAREWRKRANTQ